MEIQRTIIFENLEYLCTECHKEYTSKQATKRANDKNKEKNQSTNIFGQPFKEPESYFDKKKGPKGYFD